MRYQQPKEIISAGMAICLQQGFAIALTSLLVQPALAETKTPNFTNTEKLLLVQQSVVKITGVQVNATDKGIDVIVESANTEALQPVDRSTENNYIADIPNAILTLPEGQDFNITNPASGIVSVSVTQADANTVRVTVTGEEGLPTAQLFDSNEGLIFEFAPTVSETPPPEQPTSETPPEAPIELVVTGQQDTYRVPNASAGTRTDTPIRDIPQAIQVIPKQVLQEQRVQRLSDALRNTAGVTPGGSDRNIFDSFVIRGFSNRNIIRNGLRDDTNITSGSGIANIEQIEILRGPASVLFGQGGAGGTVNIVTKKPLETPFYSIEGTIGSDDLYSGAIDLSGPLNESKTLLYRLNASAFSSGSFVDFVDIERYLIAPVLTWRIGENTALTLEAEYFDTKQRNDRGIPALGTLLPNPNRQIPRNRFTNEPSIDKNNGQVWRVGYNLEHRFNEDWQIQNSLRGSFQKRQQNSGFPTSLDDDARTLNRGLFVAEAAVDSYILDTNLTGNFNTGNIKHQLLFGFDLTREIFQGSSQRIAVSPLDLFNPVYGSQNIGAVLDEFPNEPFTQEGLGIYLQDQISLADNFKLVIGGRLDIVNQKQEDAERNVTSFQEDTAFSPRIGIVYQPSQLVSLYANYSRSFEQVTGTTFDTALFRPERGTQYEVGAKFDWTNQLSSTLSLYQISRLNVLTSDPINPDFSIQTGEQRSRGFEVDIVGEILPGWKIIGGYAYTDAQITQDNDLPVGNRINNVPKNALSLWNTYEIQQGDLQGLGFGLGLFYIGEREGDLSNTFSLPSYLRTDAALFYRRDNFRAALNVQNLFDTEYFEVAESSLRLFYGAPRTVKFTLGWQF